MRNAAIVLPRARESRCGNRADDEAFTSTI
jgi:hypothetical protein